MSTKPFTARGKNLVRCSRCLLAQSYCTCAHCRPLITKAAFVLVMYDDEVLKPTNSGRLIADMVPDTHAFLWARTEVNPQLLALLEDPGYQPYVVFPGEYAFEGQPVVNQVPPEALAEGKRPLFIMLDGSWREAVKMFRKSPYLHRFPLLSFDAGEMARYALRKGQREFQFGTAEVAVMVLAAMGEQSNASALNAWFELFVESSLLGRNRRPTSDLTPRNELISSFNTAWQTAAGESL